MVKLLFIQRSLLQPSQLLALDVEDELNFCISYCHLVPGQWLIFLSFTKAKLQWKIFLVLYQFSFIHRVNFHLFLVMVLWESLKTIGISVNIEHPTADRAMNIHGFQGFIFFKVFLLLLFFVCFFFLHLWDFSLTWISIICPSHDHPFFFLTARYTKVTNPWISFPNFSHTFSWVSDQYLQQEISVPFSTCIVSPGSSSASSKYQFT